MTELQINIRRQVEDFFELLSSKEQLIRYKNAVPFVHIPNELIAQWNSYSRIKQSWYKEIWSTKELRDLTLFNEFFNKKIRSMPIKERRLDVPEILESKTWQKIMESANNLKITAANNN